MTDVSGIAHEAATAYLVRDPSRVQKLFAQAISLAGEDAARMAFVAAMAKKAGEERAAGNKDAVCRLKAGVYSYKPAFLTSETVRRHLIESGAAGRIARRAPSSRGMNMVAATKDPAYV